MIKENHASPLTFLLCFGRFFLHAAPPIVSESILHQTVVQYKLTASPPPSPPWPGGKKAIHVHNVISYKFYIICLVLFVINKINNI